MKIQEKVSLKDYAWWKIGGEADFFCLPESIQDLEKAVQFSKEKKVPLTILGGCTNVLISDEGVEGLVICMRKLSEVTFFEEDGRLHIECLAGTPKSELTKIFLKKKLAPALFLCGLPGDVGGGVVMNAGVGDQMVPREFVELTDWIEIYDLQLDTVRRLNKEDIEWSYRSSRGWQPGIIVRVGLSWPLEVDDTIPTKVKEATKSRLQRQPLNLPSCGSTFKNPDQPVAGTDSVKMTAGALIDQAGLKGHRVGGAEVSSKHANFIVNIGGAKAEDVHSIIKHVQGEVERRFGIRLETEVRYLGRW